MKILKRIALGISALILGLWVSGRQIKRETLEQFEQKARNRNNLIVSALRYAENLLIEK